MISTNKQDVNHALVTGLGVISSIGIGCEEFWGNLIAGKSGISEISSFSTADYDCHRGGEVKNFNPYKYMDKKKTKHLGRASKLGIAATNLAIKDSELSLKKCNPNKIAVCMGTTMGETQLLEDEGRLLFKDHSRIIEANSVITYPANNISQNISRYFKFSGHNVLFSTACAAGNYSIARGVDLIKSGKIDVAIVGGADALSRIAFTGFNRLFAMSPDKCRPFSKDRKGMMLGEGSGVLVLESDSHARKRGAKILAKVCGAGFSCDAKHMTAPSEKGVSKAIRKSIHDAKFQHNQINYFCAHGTGTPENDKAESKAIANVFQKRKIPVSSIKSMLGHTMGAASAIEAIACVLSIQNQGIPPTMNFDHKDEECNIDCVPNVYRQSNISQVINNAQAFGGNNACIVFSESK